MTIDEDLIKDIRRDPIAMEILKEQDMWILTGKPYVSEMHFTFQQRKRAYGRLAKAGLILLDENSAEIAAQIAGVENEYHAHLADMRMKGYLQTPTFTTPTPTDSPKNIETYPPLPKDIDLSGDGKVDHSDFGVVTRIHKNSQTYSPLNTPTPTGTFHTLTKTPTKECTIDDCAGGPI